ncbi:hypothetical protein AB0L40_06075 [Patulibacter sp. NPDC049589]|uniref:hypothetical protein n=1 Tax=Patulibacter sp. NPDC049589 TaxID=3154731 RepID=UPI003423FEA6
MGTMTRSRSAVVVVALSWAALVGAPDAVANSWSVGLQGSALTLPESGGGVFVDRGRVWWLTSSVVRRPGGTTEVGMRYELRSRPLRGGPTRRTGLAVTAPADAAYPRFVASQVVVSDGGAAISGQWSEPLDPGSGAVPRRLPTAQLLVFDATSGAPRSTAEYDSTSSGLVFGPTPVFGRRQTADGAASLVNPITGQALASNVPGRSAFAAGHRLLDFSTTKGIPAREWSKGAGTLTVTDLKTGRQRYRLTATQALRGADAPRRTTTDPRLQVDGSLALLLTPASRTGTYRPAWVDSRGRSRHANVWIHDVQGISTTAAHHRVLVSVSRSVRGRAGARSCSALWLGTPSGKRWRRLDDRRTRFDGSLDVVSWENDRLVIRLTTARRPADRVRVIDRPGSLDLSRTARPTC